MTYPLIEYNCAAMLTNGRLRASHRRLYTLYSWMDLATYLHDFKRLSPQKATASNVIASIIGGSDIGKQGDEPRPVKSVALGVDTGPSLQLHGHA